MFGSQTFDMQRRSTTSLPENTNKNIYLPANAPRRVWELDQMASEQAVEIDVEPKKSQRQVAVDDKGLSVCKAGHVTCTHVRIIVYVILANTALEYRYRCLHYSP